MKFNFFLPTEDEWCGTYPGGYVECVISNELCPKYDQIRIGFWGNDDMALILDSEKKDPSNAAADMMEALSFVQKIPRPISKDYLRSIGFEAF